LDVDSGRTFELKLLAKGSEPSGGRSAVNRRRCLMSVNIFSGRPNLNCHGSRLILGPTMHVDDFACNKQNLTWLDLKFLEHFVYLIGCKVIRGYELTTCQCNEHVESVLILISH